MVAYSRELQEYYKNPRNMGALAKNNPRVSTGMAGSHAGGDLIQIQILVNDNNIIEDAKFKTYGCGAAVAVSALATESIKGKTLPEAMELTSSVIAKKLQLMPAQLYCASLAEKALKAALNDFWSRNN